MPSAQRSAGQPEKSKGVIHPERRVFERMCIFGQHRSVVLHIVLPVEALQSVFRYHCKVSRQQLYRKESLRKRACGGARLGLDDRAQGRAPGARGPLSLDPLPRDRASEGLGGGLARAVSREPRSRSELAILLFLLLIDRHKPKDSNPREEYP